MGEFVDTFFKTLGYGLFALITVCLIGPVFDSVFPSGGSVTDSGQHVENENSADAQATQASIAESIYQTRAEIDSKQVPEPVSSSDVIYEGADGHTITLAHNSSAVNPTYEQVISFLKTDKTDQIPYAVNKFTCGDYAECVQHNAEAAGYKCGWVFVELGDENHACNVFNTTDRGMVYVDSTGFDSVVTVETGKEYRPIPLSKLLGYNTGVSADSMGIVNSYKIMW